MSGPGELPGHGPLGARSEPRRPLFADTSPDADDVLVAGDAEELFDDRDGQLLDVTGADVETLLRHAADMVATARRAPLSASVLIARDGLLEVLQVALERLPDELRQARWLLREGEELAGRARREADALIDEARVQAERMVERAEIVRQANQVAGRVVEEARAEARQLRHEAEDYCDQKLAGFEIVLDRTMRTVRAGREKLQLTPPTSGSRRRRGTDAAPPPITGGFFDQDEP